MHLDFMKKYLKNVFIITEVLYFNKFINSKLNVDHFMTFIYIEGNNFSLRFNRLLIFCNKKLISKSIDVQQDDNLMLELKNFLKKIFFNDYNN